MNINLYIHVFISVHVELGTFQDRENKCFRISDRPGSPSNFSGPEGLRLQAICTFKGCALEPSASWGLSPRPPSSRPGRPAARPGEGAFPQGVP